MKLKILIASAVVLAAGCTQQDDPTNQAPASTPEPATSAAAAADMPAPGTGKVEDPQLATQDYPSVERGSVLSAAGPSTAMRPMLVSGWASPEAWGVWSDGTHARIGFKIDGVIDADVEVSLLLKAFMAGSKNEVTVIPTANGRKLAPLVFRGSQLNPVPHVIRIPNQDVTQANGRIQIDFEIQDPRSPKDYGLSEDSRKLGIGLVEMSVQ